MQFPAPSLRKGERKRAWGEMVELGGKRCERVSGEEKGGEVSERTGKVRKGSPYLNVDLNVLINSSLGNNWSLRSDKCSVSKP